ncbi:MAG: hypothetical protein CR996_02380 [Draconibacterium sp.]|nr:MAG: hypothetical protein CR996_02380 [Draconibacterium sp.]
MKNKYILFFGLLVLGLATSCGKDDNYLTRMEDEREERSAYLERNGTFKLLPEGVYYQVLKAPENLDAPKVAIKDEVVVYFTGYFLDGRVFDNNVLNGKYEPMTLRIVSKLGAQIIREGAANGYTIEGWVPALLEMQEGTKARVVIPSNRAYPYGKTDGLGNIIIPMYTTLVFDLEVVEIRKPE